MRKWIGRVILAVALLLPATGFAQQGTMANSAPVVIASDQTAVPVSGTVTATGPLTDTQLRATPVPVSGTVTITDGAGALNVIVDSGTVSTITNVVHVDDNAGSLTVDNPILSVVGGGTEAAAQRVTIANNSTGLLHVDDNAGSLTIDNATLSVVGGGTEATALRVTLANNSTGVITANPSASNIVSLGVSESVAAPGANIWYLKRLWPTPLLTHFVPTRAFSSVTTAGTRTMIAIANNLGNLNVGTNTFTDGFSVASPLHYGRLIGCVTTVLSATLDTITVTYADELGNSQTTAAVTFPASTLVGNCIDMPLNATTGNMLDGGIRDITASADTAATTGVVTFYGINVILDTLGVANAYEQSDYSAGELTTNGQEQIAIFFMQAATTAQQRNAGIMGSIR